MKNSLKFHSLIGKFDLYKSPASVQRIKIFGKNSVQVRHSRNGRYFYTKPLPPDHQREFVLEKWIKLIKTSSGVDKIKNYVWPVDIVDLRQTLDDYGAKYALLFPLREDLGGYESIGSMLSNLAINARFLDLEVNLEANIKLAKNLIKAWYDFDDCKYAYHEFSFFNMLINMENEVMFDFSFSAHEYKEKTDGVIVHMNRIHPDYTDTYYFQRKSMEMDVISDYFSMAVILFRLLIGCLPYQGRLLEGLHNLTAKDHSDWVKQYHKNPIFIFDSNEDLNRISSTANPEKYEERWERLSPLAKGMFSAIFNTDNVMRKSSPKTLPKFYTPQDWKNLLL